MKRRQLRVALACVLAIVLGMFLPKAPAFAGSGTNTISGWGTYNCFPTSDSSTVNYCNFLGKDRTLNQDKLTGKAHAECYAGLSNDAHSRIKVACDGVLRAQSNNQNNPFTIIHCNLLDGSNNDTGGNIVHYGEKWVIQPADTGWSQPDDYIFNVDLANFEPELGDDAVVKCYVKFYISSPDLSGGTYSWHIFLPNLRRIHGTPGPGDSYSYWQFAGPNSLPGEDGPASGPDHQTHVTEWYSYDGGISLKSKRH